MTMRTFLSLTAVFSLFFLSAAYASQAKPAAGAKPAAQAASPESITNGAALYKRHCVMCHGATGVGDGPAAKTLKGKLPNLSDKAMMSKHSDDEIREVITNGKKTEIGNMPALGKRLSPEEINDVISFVRTLAK
jgi:mono/diheme cytochrome c family protein